MADERDPDESDGTNSDADPRAVRSLAVTVEDVVAAYEARRRGARRTVLRVTPPFSGRMRARLHEAELERAEPERAEQESAGDGDSGDSTDLDPATGALHVPPSRFVDEDAISPYPDPDDTEDALREDPDVEFSVEIHRERHVGAVAAWRESVGEALVDSVVVRLSDGTHRVRVQMLGGVSEE